MTVLLEDYGAVAFIDGNYFTAERAVIQYPRRGAPGR